MSYQTIKKKTGIMRTPARSTAVKNTLGYSTRNVKFKRLEPHFQLSATRSASKEGTETAVALSHSRECTKEPISALPNNGSMEKFGAKAELLWNIKSKVEVLPVVDLIADSAKIVFFFVCKQCSTGDEGTPVFPLFNLRHPRDFKSTTYRRGNLY